MIVRLQGQTFGYQPLAGAPATGSGSASPAKGGSTEEKGGGGKPSSSSPLLYHGGPVMASNTNYAIYWDPSGAPGYPSGYEAGIDRFFEDLAHDSGLLTNTDSILTQYGDSGGDFANYASHFGGAFTDTDPYPANGCAAAPRCLTDAQIRAELQSFVATQKLPIDLEHAYFLLTPAGVESCMDAEEKSCSAGTSPPHRNFCAYHGYVLDGGAPLVYANDPFVEKFSCDVGEEHPNGNASDATIAGGLAHEHSEAVTDPELNAWYDAKGNEVADKCRQTNGNTKKEYGEPLGKAPDGANYNEVINGDFYLYQMVWSNSAAECRQRVAELPVLTKLSPKAGSAAGGTSVTLTGGGFTNPASVHFGEAAATEVHVVSSSTITAVTPAGSPGAKVNVTVTTSAGTTAVTKKTTLKYKS